MCHNFVFHFVVILLNVFSMFKATSSSYSHISALHCMRQPPFIICCIPPLCRAESSHHPRDFNGINSEGCYILLRTPLFGMHQNYWSSFEIIALIIMNYLRHKTMYKVQGFIIDEAHPVLVRRFMERKRNCVRISWIINISVFPW